MGRDLPEAEGLENWRVTSHAHTWAPIAGTSRYRCACGVIGHLPALLYRQRDTAHRNVIAYACQRQVAGHRKCGAEATYVTGDRQASRCNVHAPAAAVAPAGFCAICTSTVGPFVDRPLGGNDALVKVCTRCDGERPVEGRGRELGYVVPDGMTWLEFNKRVDRFRSSRGIPKAEPYTSVTKRLTPGWILVRVPGLDEKGRRRDMYEASLTFAHEPWAADAAWVGATASWCLFERPDPANTSAGPSRNKSQHDVSAFR